jgi:SNF2 family DNA or RNA helicase
MRFRSDLRKYQIRFLNKIKRLKHLILALPMGSGKSATTLTAVLDLLDEGEVERVLIVAPLLVATATWPDEIEEWDHLSDLEYTLIRAENDDPEVVSAYKGAYSFARNVIGMDTQDASSFAGRRRTMAKESKRRRLAATETEIHIINKEHVPWLWAYFEGPKRWPYDMLVVDEASMFKNAKMRTENKALSRFGVMAKARKLAHRTVLLTGTPAPKGLINLFGLLFICDLGKRLGNSMFKFEQKYFHVADKRKYGVKPMKGSEQKIMAKVSDVMFSLREEDCVKLPPNVPVEAWVDLPQRALDEYKRFERSLYSERYDVEAVNRGVLHSKLLQFANGSLYNEDREALFVHDEKLRKLEEIIEDASGDPVLIAYTFKFDLDRIRKRWKKAAVFGEGDVRLMKKKWNNGDIPIMVAHGNSIGHGQNIQYGGYISVWYGLTPDLEIYQQFNKRLHRPGQTKVTFTHHILARDTYDEELLPLLNERNATQERIIDSVRVKF